MCNYWMHRISYQAEVSYQLLHKFSYLSIGFGEILNDEELLDLLKDEKRDIYEKHEAIENFMLCKWGSKPKSRFSLYRFLFDFKVGDIVIVPIGKEFFVYRILSEWASVYEALCNKLTDDDNFVIKNKHIYKENRIIDLGFVIKVERVLETAIPRSGYCDNNLLKMMKTLSTNADLTNLKEEVNKAIQRFQENSPINIYEETIKSVDNALLEIIKTKIDSSQFEKLIKWYFEKIGADRVEILAKNEAGKEDNADADIMAVFENLHVVIFVQAKQHDGTTSLWAVEQISKYYKQKRFLEDYTYIPWVISTSDDFSIEAKVAAFNVNGDNNFKVRLISGLEFAHMLLDAGIKDINNAF